MIDTKTNEAAKENTEPNTETDIETNTETNTEINTDSKEINFAINMNRNILYDYMVHHEYTSGGGILGTCFGLLGVFMYFQAEEGKLLFLIIGLLLIFYMPINLKYKSFLQMKMTESFKKPLHYTVDQQGITVSQDETVETVEWAQCTKAVSTKLSIVVYTGKRNAFIFPRKDLGDKITALIATISENMDPKKIKIRF